MTWLVTGGAGYIGSHVVRAFIADGINAVVIDDLSSGHRSFVRGDVPFYEGSVLQRKLLDQIFTEHKISGVVHLAGFKYAGVSVSRPLHTYTAKRDRHGHPVGVDGCQRCGQLRVLL